MRRDIYTKFVTFGVYPQATIDNKGVRTERTQWQEGWNAAFMEISKRIDPEIPRHKKDVRKDTIWQEGWNAFMEISKRIDPEIHRR